MLTTKGQRKRNGAISLHIQKMRILRQPPILFDVHPSASYYPRTKRQTGHGYFANHQNRKMGKALTGEAARYVRVRPEPAVAARCEYT